MAPGDVVPDHAKQLKPKEKRPGNTRAPKAECEPDGSFVFEAHEAWRDFYTSLRHFYEAGELCDVTLKVGHSSTERDLFVLYLCLNSSLFCRCKPNISLFYFGVVV